MTISAILLNPGNRLLAGGTSDFAMFGGQPSAVAIGAPALNDGGTISARAPGTDADNDETSARTIETPSLYTGYAPHGGDPDANASAAQLSGASPAATHTPFQYTANEATPATPHGSGAANPFAPPVLDTTSQHDAAPDAEALASPTYSAAFAPAVVGAAGEFTDLLHTTLATTGAAAAQLGDLAGAALDTIGSLASDTVALADTTIGVVQGSVEATVLPLVDHLAVGGDLGSDLLAGTDPVGGIATLTSMVGSADVFEIAGHGAAPVSDAVTSTLDAVPDDGGLLSPLLGEHHADDAAHHDGLLDGHGLGIPGL